MCKHPDHLSAADFFKEQRGPLCTSYISATLNNLLVYRANWTVHKKWKYEDWFFYKFHFLRVMSTVLSFNVKINGYILRENGFIYISWFNAENQIFYFLMVQNSPLKKLQAAPVYPGCATLTIHTTITQLS